jgi:hypothetical protein
LQTRTNSNITIFNVKYLCNRLETTTSNINRTKFIANCLDFFENNNIIKFYKDIDYKDIINGKEFVKNSKTSILFGEFYEDIDNIDFIEFNNLDISNLH